MGISSQLVTVRRRTLTESYSAVSVPLRARAIPLFHFAGIKGWMTLSPEMEEERIIMQYIHTHNQLHAIMQGRLAWTIEQTDASEQVSLSDSELSLA